MTKFEELFSQYPCLRNDEEVKNAIATILSEEYEANNNEEVWKQCLHQIDLTTLNGDDTTEKVVKMTSKVNDFPKQYPSIPNVAALCVYPALVSAVHETLTEPVGIAAVAAGFPASQTFIGVKGAESALTVKEGATEIDIVISIGKFLEGNYQEVFDEIAEIKDAVQPAHLKVILETGALKTAENIYKASILAMAAGADFIKTSTGFGGGGATREDVALFAKHIGPNVKIKAAGGIANLQDAEDFIRLGASRLGTSRIVKAVKAMET